MRKLILALVGALCFAGPALAPAALPALAPIAASAANCTPGQGAIFYNGQWAWNAHLTGCVGVDAVRFYGSNTYPTLVGVQWYQGTGGRFFPALQGATVTLSGVRSSYDTYYSVNVFGPGCGAPPITVSTIYVFQLHNSTTATWGQPTYRSSTQYPIC